MGRDTLFDVSARLVHQTPAAFLLEDGNTKAWVAKSLAECDHEDPEPGKVYIFTMPEWVAIEKRFV